MLEKAWTACISFGVLMLAVAGGYESWTCGASFGGSLALTGLILIGIGILILIVTRKETPCYQDKKLESFQVDQLLSAGMAGNKKDTEE